MHLARAAPLFALFAAGATAQSRTRLFTCTATTPPSAQSACGQHGRFIQRYETLDVGAAENLPSVEDCAALCAGRPLDFGYNGCGSFAWDAKTKFCQLLYGPVDKKQLRKPAPDNLAYYDATCFACTPAAICPEPLGVDLLFNDNFERKLVGPWYKSNGTVLSGTGGDKSRVFQCDGNPGYPVFECTISQEFNVCPDELYELSFQWKFSTEAGAAKSITSWLASDRGLAWSYNFTLDPKLADSGVWRSYSTIVRSPSSGDFPSSSTLATLGFSFSMDFFSSSTINARSQLDNVRLVRAASPALKPGAKTRIVNGGFESGSLAPWKIVSHTGIGEPEKVFKIVKPGLSGSKFAAQQVSQGSFFETLQQRVRTTNGTLYLFSMELNIPTYDNSAIITVFLESGGHMTELVENQFAVSPAVPRTVTSPYRAEGPITTIQLIIEPDTFDPQQITFDNVKLTEAAE